MFPVTWYKSCGLLLRL